MKDRHSRQTFLGPEAESLIDTARLSIVGLGGGGSHVVQQLAHVGFRNYIIVDPDEVEFSNLNRLVGATLKDAAEKRPKVQIAARLIQGLVDRPNISGYQKRWQDVADDIVRGDILISCVDSVANRRDLEAHCRRYFVPMIDIGMDVKIVHPEPPRMYGQIAISVPGEPCLRCLGVITDASLAAEAQAYGDAGPRPQVVWANGMLASAAVGQAVAMLTGWTVSGTHPRVLSFDGNRGTLEPDKRLPFLPQSGCPHYPVGEAGPTI